MDKDADKDLPPFTRILVTIRQILMESAHPYRVVHTCVETVDKLIEQSLIVEKDKPNGLAQGCTSPAEAKANRLEAEQH